jgi:hypothetical protein
MDTVAKFFVKPAKLDTPIEKRFCQNGVTAQPCHCEEGDLPDEAISCYTGIASGKEQERPRNDR